jgi:hypothetical protein
MSSTASFPGNSFFFKNSVGKRVAQFTVDPSKYMVIVGPPKDDELALKSDLYLEYKQSLKFRNDFLKRTGKPWLGHYPPNPPNIPFWPSDFVGQAHR